MPASARTQLYVKGQCGWPQACLKSLGWVVASSTVEAADFGNGPPTRIVTKYKYKDARADRTGRGLLGMSNFTRTTEDELTHRVLAQTTSEFDLTKTVCQDADHYVLRLRWNGWA